ncbi:hypothetical protein [Streptomyces sp. DH8]|uniref:hypothetical protein n=1 Tax=Streptomyces sp. DH8 TaxID=2857008 RepID=UPI001E2E4E71|nr:hypothetical protein [Streptomyces sp. DH8]
MAATRDTDALLADMDALLAEIPETAPAPAAEPEPAPEPPPAPKETPASQEPRGDTWEEVTAPRPASDRNRTIRRHGWQPRDLPEPLKPKQDPAPAPTPAPVEDLVEDDRDEDQADGPAKGKNWNYKEALDDMARLLGPLAPPSAHQPPAPAPAAPPAAGHPAKATSDDGEEDEDEGDAPAPAPTGAHVIATTVSAWRPPSIGGKSLWSFLGYNALAAGIGLGSGFTKGFYVALETMSINPDAVAGVAISAAIVALAIRRTWQTFACLGAALVVVLLVQLLSLPVFAGLVALLIVWGVDQRARSFRQPFSLAFRTVFIASALALGALTWTTVVPVLTGATQ